MEVRTKEDHGNLFDVEKILYRRVIEAFACGLCDSGSDRDGEMDLVMCVVQVVQ